MFNLDMYGNKDASYQEKPLNFPMNQGYNQMSIPNTGGNMGNFNYNMSNPYPNSYNNTQYPQNSSMNNMPMYNNTMNPGMNMYNVNNYNNMNMYNVNNYSYNTSQKPQEKIVLNKGTLQSNKQKEDVNNKLLFTIQTLICLT